MNATEVVFATAAANLTGSPCGAGKRLPRPGWPVLGLGFADLRGAESGQGLPDRDLVAVEVNVLNAEGTDPPAPPSSRGSAMIGS